MNYLSVNDKIVVRRCEFYLFWFNVGMLGMDRKSVVRVSLGDEKVDEKGIDIVESKR